LHGFKVHFDVLRMLLMRARVLLMRIMLKNKRIVLKDTNIRHAVEVSILTLCIQSSRGDFTSKRLIAMMMMILSKKMYHLVCIRMRI